MYVDGTFEKNLLSGSQKRIKCTFFPTSGISIVASSKLGRISSNKFWEHSYEYCEHSFREYRVFKHFPVFKSSTRNSGNTVVENIQLWWPYLISIETSCKTVRSNQSSISYTESAPKLKLKVPRQSHQCTSTLAFVLVVRPYWIGNKRPRLLIATKLLTVDRGEELTLSFPS